MSGDAGDGTSGQRGVTFASFQRLGLPAAIEAAAWADELGYRSFWTAETVGPEAFATLAAVGARQPTLDLGTSVLALQLRSPMLVAMGAATLQALHPDRAILIGIGISSPVVTEQWHAVPYGDRPVDRVREYVALVRECLSGETVTFEGDFWQVRKFRLDVRLPEDVRPRIVVGALNPRMLQLAGEVADGVLLNYLPASHVPSSVEHVRAGEARSGNRCVVHAMVHVGRCERTERAVELARRDLFSYAVVPSYARSFTRAGFGDEVEAITEAHRARDRAGALAAVTDRMVDAIDIVGDAATVAGAVDAYVAAGVDDAVIMPLPWGDDRLGTLRATLDAAAPR
jgi:probable F420-dependent oxidoreductase